MTSGKANKMLRVLAMIFAFALIPHPSSLILSAYGAFDDLGAGARAPGMGNAFVAVADDIYALYYNPAGLTLLPRPEMATSYTQHFRGLSDNSFLSTSFLGYAQPLRNGDLGWAGAALQQFNLDSGLYQEQTFYLSYGNTAPRSLGLDGLSWGTNLKYLRRAFGVLPEASNAYNGLLTTGQSDPVLSGKRHASALDADLGFLYRMKKNYSVGLGVVHLARPDVAFGSGAPEKLPVQLKLGFDYRSLLSNISVQYDTMRAPTGARDHRITVGTERWFPWLLVGNIGARCSLGIGSRDYGQMTAGISYRNDRIGIDYGFLVPLNTLVSSGGTHRLSFSVRFGPARGEDESVQAVLEAMRRMKAGTVPEVKPEAGIPQEQKTTMAEYLNRARFLETEARYQEASDELGKALSIAPQDENLLKHQSRLNFISVLITSLPDYKTDVVQSALYRAALAYLGGRDEEALGQAAYALSLEPASKDVNNFIVQLELITGLKRPKLAIATEPDLKTEQNLTLAANAIESGHYDEAVKMSEAVLKSQPDNIAALENLGIAYFARGDYQGSLSSWEKAYALETVPARRTMMAAQIESVRNVSSRQKRRPQPAPPSKASAADVRRAYQEGLDLYGSGSLEKARAQFQKVLEMDPGNVLAANALKRIQQEQLSR